ncbi:ATP-binding cassette domain-containing protein [Bradyrhizobium manausense]|uniref:ATP-binding cassette domain-containing protein n=1 Tax=Bradyrhizobium manausense TaxID=989370 RepID=UPI001BA6DD14|nr:ATP-binding cassette domain-containing protein [Bradyrhizobium manausense]MBR0828568.1 ATP-binding cassette domain-containing protein [Bradyrhizobium manausense]
MLEVNNLGVRYGRHTALQGVSLHVERGEISVMLGANGAGKSSLLKAVAGIVPTEPGSEIRMNGRAISGLEAHLIVEQGVALVPEGRGVFGELTVEENLGLGAFAKRARAKQQSTLQFVYGLFPRLAERKRQQVRTMSGGEQQMVAISRALMSRPDILMLDEPSLGLSPLLSKELFRSLRRIAENGFGILLVEQNARLSLKIADRGYLIENGALAGEDSAENLQHNPAVISAYLGGGAEQISSARASAAAASAGPAASTFPNRAAALLSGASVEIIAKDADELEQAVDLLAPGTAVSIPFIGSDDIAARVRAAARVRELGFEPVPHLSARRVTSVAELDGFLSALAARAGVRQALVIGGDLPSPAGPFEDSLGVIKTGLLARHGIKKVGIGGYPEGHPSIGVEALERALHDKLQWLTENGHEPYITTQFSFGAQPVLEWLVRLRGAGIGAPVQIGVPGPASVKTLLRFASRCGVAASAQVMAKYGISLTKLLSTAGPDNFVSEIVDGLNVARHGQVSLHFYPFGGLKATAEWIDRFNRVGGH